MISPKQLIAALGLATGIGRAEMPPPNDFMPQPQVEALSPEEFPATVELPDGYSLEFVLSEPQIPEPAANRHGP